MHKNSVRPLPLYVYKQDDLSHISRTTELTKSYLFIYLFTLSVGLKYEVVVSRSAECCTQFSRERDQQSAYFPTNDIFLNFGFSRRLAVYSKPDSVCKL